MCGLFRTLLKENAVFECKLYKMINLAKPMLVLGPCNRQICPVIN